jgi:hypothetical protein
MSLLPFLRGSRLRPGERDLVVDLADGAVGAGDDIHEVVLRGVLDDVLAVRGADTCPVLRSPAGLWRCCCRQARHRGWFHHHRQQVGSPHATALTLVGSYAE